VILFTLLRNAGSRREIIVGNTAPTFGERDGKVTTDFGANDAGNSVAVQADGKILVAGNSTGTAGMGFKSAPSDFALARYNTDGTPDASFSTDGKVTTNFSGWGVTGYSLAVQADGKIVVAGSANQLLRIYFDYALARYNTNGSLDTSFSADGKVSETTESDFSPSRFVSSVAVQADGKILVAGFNGSNFLLVRYNTDGTLDTSFSQQGTVSGTGHSVTLQADGKILVAGDGSGDLVLVRYNPNGSLDTSFDTDGKVTTSGFSGFSVTAQADGKILVAGSSISAITSRLDFALVRYNTNGSLDTSFDTDGKVTTNIGPGVSSDTSVVLQADGKILVAGTNGSDFALARYNTNGSLDTSFDTDGKVTTDFGANDAGRSVAVQADGKILVAGNSGADFALVRYNPDGSLDTSFAKGNTAAYTENAIGVVLDGNIQIADSELSAANSYNGSTLTLSRNSGASAQDVFAANSAGTLTPLLAGRDFAVDNITIGQVTTNSAGTLTLKFGINATQLLVTKAMQQIAYANSSDAPPATVQIDWTFNDGNTGAQGTGGALSATASTTIQITSTNDIPILAHALVDQVALIGMALSYTLPSDSFTDSDAETLTYRTVMADGTGMASWLTFNAATHTFSGTPVPSNAGRLDIRVTATDTADASVTDDIRFTVSAPDSTAPTVKTFRPVDGATNVPITANIVVTFDETIQLGTGSILLKNAAGQIVETYNAANSTSLALSGSALTLNPTNDLAYSTGYRLEFDAGAIKDMAGNDYAGTAAYNFTTLGTLSPGGAGNRMFGLQYIASYPDLINVIGLNAETGVMHYLQSGLREGRTATFDGLTYIASYPDLIAAFGLNAETGAAHYIQSGMREGRTATFDGLKYVSSYPDLIAAFGLNAEAGVAHYIQSGFHEGRAIFDGLAYIAAYPDLINAFGMNPQAGVTHYLQSGLHEGRNATFDGESYLLANLDLLAGFGGDPAAGVRHYIHDGYREGRETSLSSWQHGYSGDDVLSGTSGKDMLDGGTGHDTLTGGAGQDLFVLRVGDGGSTLQLADVITDFQDGTDRLALAGSLDYTDLTFQQGTGAYAADTIVSSVSGEYLAILNDLLAANINGQDFVHL